MKIKSVYSAAILTAVLCIGCFASAAFSAISEHILYAELDQTWDYGDASNPNDFFYCFSWNVEADNTVQYIKVLTPGGKEFVIIESEYSDEYGDWWKFEYDDSMTDPRELSAYGDGVYIMTVYYSDGSSEQTNIIYSGLSQPTQEPIPVFPLPGQRVLSPVRFQWEPCTDSAPTNIWFDVEDMEGEEVIDTIDVSPAVDQTGNVCLNIGHYTASMGFENSQPYTNEDGIYITRWKSSSVEWEFAVFADDGDVNGDVRINLEDYSIFAQWWLDDCDTSNNWCEGADFDLSGKVDMEDLLVFVSSWLDGGKISDHIFGISIETGIDYQNPNISDDTLYEFTINVDSDSSVQQIEFVPPAGGLYELTKNDLWEYAPNFSTAAGFADFGDGEYQFTITLEDGHVFHTSVWFTIPGTRDPIPQPTQKPTYTSFSNGDVLTSPVILKWEACIDPDLYVIGASVTNTDTWEDLLDTELPGNATELGELLYLSNGNYEIDLSFDADYDTINADGIPIELQKWCESDYAITVTVTGLPEDLVSIPAGTFQMGDSIGDGLSFERPVHTVTVDSFAMGKYEITNGQYCAFLKAAYPSQLKVVSGVVYSTSDTGNSYPYCATSTRDPSSQLAFSNKTFSVRTNSGRDMTNDPMVCVSWYGSVAYCNWRSQQEGKQICYNLSTWDCNFSKKGYRLATEAEWEYAARGGRTGSRFPWGDTITHNQANYYSWGPNYDNYDTSPTRGYHPAWNDGIKPYTSPGGSFPANAYGLCDMAGNVSEWCNDWYSGYSSDSQTNPTGPTTGSYRVIRGGGWDSGGSGDCRVSKRDYHPHPDYRYDTFGFRVVLDF